MNMNEELEFNEIVEGDVLTEEEMMAISGGMKG